MVDRFVEGRAGIDVAAETHADRLKVLHQFTGLEIGRPIEQHVLEEMGIAALLIRFVQRSGLDVEIGRDPVTRFPVFLQHIAQTVGQDPSNQAGIGMQIAARGRPVR